MRFAWAAAVWAVILSGSCIREGNYKNVESVPHEWNLPGPECEQKVFGPISLGEVDGFVRQKQAEGWEVIGYEPASLPEEIMVDTVELDRPVPGRRRAQVSDLPKTMDDRMEAPGKATIPSYLDDGVREHRRKYLVVLRRWL